jgi:hypothetical protein
MDLAIDEAALLADTSTFCRFAESGVCELFVDYLASRLHLTTWVIGELEHRAAQPAHAQLDALAKRRPPWVANPVVRLSEDELKRADALAMGWRMLQERQTGAVRDERANLGEATTIVAAQRTQWAALLDEGKARRYAEGLGLRVFSTQDLVVEIAAAGKLRERRAWRVYERVYSGASAAQFAQDVASIRETIAARSGA